MTDEFNKIPNELKMLPYWMTWRYEPKEDGGKPAKVPNQKPGYWPNNLFTFSEALKRKKDDGIGIVLAGNLVGIDIDDIDETKLPDDIQMMLDVSKNAYVEKSVSGNGYHIIGYCNNKDFLLNAFKQYNDRTGARKNGIEMYATKRFFTVSGNTIHGNYGCIDLAIMLAWERITGKPLFTYIKTDLQTPSQTTLQLEPQKQENSKESSKQKSPINTIISATYKSTTSNQEDLNDSYLQKILSYPGLPMKTTIAIMYKNDPILKTVLENGYSSVPNDWHKTKDTDVTNSGIDMKIAGKLCYWLKRYGKDNIVLFMKQSAVYRSIKNKDYISKTVEKAYKTTPKPFPAINYAKLTHMQENEFKKWEKSQR